MATDNEHFNHEVVEHFCLGDMIMCVHVNHVRNARNAAIGR